MRRAIGPETKATNAIGLVVAVATETSPTPTASSARRLRRTSMPSAVAVSSPSCSTDSRPASSSASGTSTSIETASAGTPSHSAVLRLPVSQRSDSWTSSKSARVCTNAMTLWNMAATPIPIRISRAPTTPP